jgi:hypothetical protein
METVMGVVLAAALVLGPRPPDLVKTGEEAGYAAWVEGQARKAAGYYARSDCAAAALTPEAFGPANDPALAALKPGATLYTESFAIEGCGAARAQGLVVFRDKDGWSALPTAPGESRAGLALQRAVLPSVILAVKAAAEADTSCSPVEKAQSALIYDTRVIGGQGAEGGEGKPWTERWFMSVCGAGYKIDIDFQPQAGGGAGFQVRVVP